MAWQEAKARDVGAERVTQCGRFPGPLGVGEFVERDDAALGEVRLDLFQGRTCWFVEVEVEVGQGDEGVRIVFQVPGQSLANITINDEGALDVAERFKPFVHG